MKKVKIREGEPVAFNPKTETAVIKEVTDSSIEIFTVNTRNGEAVSSEIFLKPEKFEKNGSPFSALPTLQSSCVQDDGTIVLLVNYENMLLTKNSDSPYSEEAAESIDFLYVYEKGDVEKIRKYIFPQSEIAEDTTAKDDFWEEPEQIQCFGGNIYLFSEKSYANDEIFYRLYKPNRLLSRINLNPQKEEKNITDIALIVYDDIRFKYYSEKERALYTFTRSLEEDTMKLRILRLEYGYELPEEPVEMSAGDFLFSETPDGKPLIFFVKTRNNLEEQRIELLPL